MGFSEPQLVQVVDTTKTLWLRWVLAIVPVILTFILGGLVWKLKKKDNEKEK